MATHRALILAAAPTSVHGSPETLVSRGVRVGASRTGAFAAELVDAVDGRRSASSIRTALDAAGKRYKRFGIDEAVERELLQGAMLGALDADWEAENESPIELPSFTELHGSILLATGTGFAGRPLVDAIRAFLQREVVTRDVFDRLAAAAQRRAFTVARLASVEMIRTVKRELIRQLALGADLRSFAEFARTRLEAAGWVPANPSHVETIFRTNVISAYGGGRYRQMTQPRVLKARPYWQILGVTDSRQRKTHRAAHGSVLRSDDPFWLRAYPPFGYNCRCRVRSMGASAAARVVAGSTIRGLPDRGFASGTGALLAA